MSEAFGIDIGGSGIKGARVNLETGELSSERIRIPTPKPATPSAVIEVAAEVAEQSDWSGPVGCTFPAIVQHGVVHSATNVDKTWIGINAEELLCQRLSQPVSVLNDADAAGIAEMRYGAGREFQDRGIVMMLTFGTGIGSAIFNNGVLLPNTELGELQLDGVDIEERAAGRLREKKILSWEEWTKQVEYVLQHIEKLFSPDLIVFGGGISSKHQKFLPNITTKTRVVPAELRNLAGIVGAALAGSGEFSMQA